MKTLITGATVVNEGMAVKADILIEDDRIVSILSNGETPRDNYDETVDATGCFVLPGVIDDHVHFRDPGLTHKADMQTESRAAAYGGVTTYFDMPNTKPQTTTLADLEDKLDMARQNKRQYRPAAEGGYKEGAGSETLHGIVNGKYAR